MKAERRHELAENELAKVIKKAPTFWQQSGGKFLLALIVVLLIVILLQYRSRSAREATVQATQQLTAARSYIQELQGQAMLALFAPPQEVALRRKQAISEGNAAIENALQLSEARQIEAEALLARGDLYWTAATLPEVPGAATQPSLQMRSPTEYLATAQDAYQTVVNSYADIVHAAAAARFGLAAIHEQRGQWDAARALYEQIAADPDAIPAYKELADVRLQMLPVLRQPAIFGQPTTEPALATETAATALPPLIAAPATTQATLGAAAAAATPAIATTTQPAPNATTRP